MRRYATIGVIGLLVIAGMNLGLASVRADCNGWPGGGLDDGPYQSLYSIGAPLQGQGNIDRAAARALWEAWHAAGHPEGFDAGPYLKAGPGCDENATTSNNNDGSNNTQHDRDDNDNHRDHNDNRRRNDRNDND